MTSPPPETRDLASLTRLSDGGRTAEVFAWDETTVLKLARDDSFRLPFEIEAAGLQAAGASPGLAPAFRGTVDVDGRPGILMERLDGIDLLTEIEKKPWRINRIGRELAEQHARLHAIAAPPGLYTAKQRIAYRLQSDAIPPEVRAQAERWLADAPEGDRLCHGDFHPGNLMRTATGLRIIDFANGCPGDPTYDFATTLCLLRLGEPPPSTARWVRMVMGVARKLLIRSYTSTYRKLRPVNEHALANWERLFLATRLDDRIPEERDRILRELRASPSASVNERAV